MTAQVYGDRWKVLKQLGEGGQAHTFLVVDIRGDAGNQYVLKRLKNVKRLERFRSEVEAVRNLSHQNVIRLLDFDLGSDKPYLVSEFCSGGNLAENKARWIEDRNEALRLFIQTCDGVAAAHNKGIVHRDIKPENILLRQPDGMAVVADFGLCYIEGGHRQTLSEEAVGPRLYMAPELEEGRVQNVETQSDVYSLGKLLYWLLSSGKIFSREKHRQPDYNLVDLYGDGKLELVNRLLDWMITEDPNHRLAKAGDVLIQARNLARVLAGGYNAPSLKVPQMCMYCGNGNYQPVVQGDPGGVNDFGFRAVAGNPPHQWLIMVCNTCGHVQLFRLENLKTAGWFDGWTYRIR